jgi:hypothetical protein
MEIAGLAFGIVGLLAPVEKVISRLRTRFGNYRDNEGRVNELSSCCTRIRDNLNTLKKHLAPGRRNLPADTVKALSLHVAAMTAFFNKAEETIDKMAENVATRAKRFRHASRVANAFNDLLTVASSRGETLITLIAVLGAAQGSTASAPERSYHDYCRARSSQIAARHSRASLSQLPYQGCVT